MFFMNYIQYFLVCFFLVYIFFFFAKKKKLFQIKKTNLHNNFTTNKDPYLLGGPVIFCFLIYYFNNDLFLIFFSFCFLVIGVSSDAKIINNPQIRLCLQTIATFLSVIFLDLFINNTKFLPLDFFLQYKIPNLIFVTFCILILINGCNFIDGLNNLLNSYIIVLIISIIILQTNTFIDIYFLKKFGILLFVLFIFNFFGKIFLGDSGSYLIGFIFAYILIKFSQSNQVSPYYIILLLWYPCFEVLFSIIRRLARNKKLQNPDTKHLHQLLWKFIQNNTKIQSSSSTHLITIGIINLYNFLIFNLANLINYHTQYLICLIFLNIFVYNFSYYFLFKSIIKKRSI